MNEKPRHVEKEKEIVHSRASPSPWLEGRSVPVRLNDSNPLAYYMTTRRNPFKPVEDDLTMTLVDFCSGATFDWTGKSTQCLVLWEPQLRLVQTSRYCRIRVWSIVTDGACRNRYHR